MLALIEVGFAEVFVRMLVNEQVIDDTENAVRHGDHRLLRSVTCRQSAELRGQVSLRPGRGVCRFDQCTAQPAIALTCLAAPSFAGALILTRTQTSPGGEVTRAREAPNVWTDLRDDDFCSATANTRNRVKSLQHHLKRALAFFDLSAQSLDGLVEEAICARISATRNRWCEPNRPTKARSSVARLSRILPRARSAITVTSV